jgi:alkanesulfonate monooxygenase SsuD/methylene tetrahydromethanopterin reductase-like flavin-dependent oxidoreductase (luciferase family)
MKVGLMLPFGEQDDLGRPLTWQQLRELSITAEQRGLDSVWGADHLIFRSRDGTLHGIHECWTLLTAVAVLTSRVEIGPLVLALPFRNPALVAKMATALDEVSGGRLILGLGCGWHEPEFEAFDYPFDHRVGRFEESISVLIPLLRQGRVRFDARWHRADAALLPPGPRPSGPPILIAGKGPRMMRLTAQHADQWNAAWYGRPADAVELDERIAALRQACDAQGRDPGTLTLTAGLFVVFPELVRKHGGEEPPEEAIVGDVDGVGRELAGYRDKGIEHVIVHLWPRDPEAVRWLGEAAEVARAATTIGAA